LPVSDLVSESSDHVVQSIAHGGVGQAHFRLHPVELALAADERLHELQLLGAQMVEAAEAEMAVERRVTAPTVETRDIHILAANRTLAKNSVHGHLRWSQAPRQEPPMNVEQGEMLYVNLDIV